MACVNVCGRQVFLSCDFTVFETSTREVPNKARMHQWSLGTSVFGVRCPCVSDSALWDSSRCCDFRKRKWFASLQLTSLDRAAAESVRSHAQVKRRACSLAWAHTHPEGVAPHSPPPKAVLSVHFNINPPIYKFSGVEVTEWYWSPAPSKEGSER